MNGRGFSLGRILGVPVGADLSVLLIGAFLAWSFATNLLPEAASGHVPTTYWSVGIVGAFVFLASLLAHELSHSVVARRNDVGVEGITLWLFGGVARLQGDPPGPGAEFRIAAAGPAMSVAIGLGLFVSGIGLDFVGGPDVWIVMLKWLGFINVFLAVFNLLPGAPLDGGRILGAALWKIRGNRASGLAGAAQVGKVLAVLLIAAGFAEMFYLGGFSGIWTIMIGFFLFNAARSEAAHYNTERALGGLTVAGAMLAPVRVTSTWNTAASAVEGPFTHSTQSAVPVVDATGQVRGLITMEQVTRLPAEQWAGTNVGDVMMSLGSVAMVDPAEPMINAVQLLGPSGHALVLHGRELVGMLGPAEVERSVTLADARRTGGPSSAAGVHGTPPPPPSVPGGQQWQAPVRH